MPSFKGKTVALMTWTTLLHLSRVSALPMWSPTEAPTPLEHNLPQETSYGSPSPSPRLGGRQGYDEGTSRAQLDSLRSARDLSAADHSRLAGWYGAKVDEHRQEHSRCLDSAKRQRLHYATVLRHTLRTTSASSPLPDCPSAYASAQMHYHATRAADEERLADSHAECVGRCTQLQNYHLALTGAKSAAAASRRERDERQDARGRRRDATSPDSPVASPKPGLRRTVSSPASLPNGMLQWHPSVPSHASPPFFAHSHVPHEDVGWPWF